MSASFSELWAHYDFYTGQVLARRESDLDVYKKSLSRLAQGGGRVLHLGCGWDRSQVYPLLREVCEVVGVDSDLDAGKRYPGTFWLADARRLPFGDGTFDVVCSEYLFEHVEDEDSFVAELARVLAPGGQLLALTPNQWSYKSLVARWTPRWFHVLVAGSLRPDGRAPADVYPTYFRLNGKRQLCSLATKHGLVLSSVTYLNNGPTWFRRLPGLFEVGRAYHWVLDKVAAFESLQCGLLIECERERSRNQQPRQPLTIRCKNCGSEGMVKRGSCWECTACDSRIVIEDGIPHAL